jgi:hypothetical protein
LDLQRVAAIAGFGLLVYACGDKFTAGEPAAGGSAGSGVPAAGAPAGGDPGTDGGVDAGGAPSVAGKSSGGRGGVSSVAGSAGKGGSGGKGGVNAGGSGGSGGSVVEVPPVPLEGLELWFDATEGVTEANGVVTVWKDRSGHQRDARQTAANYRPKLGKSALNGKAAVVFDGVDDYLKLPALPGDFSQGLSIFVMAQQDSDDGRCAGFFEASNGPEIDDVHLGFWEGLMQYEVYADQLHPLDQPILLNAPELLAVVHHTTLGVQMRRNSNGLGETSFGLPAVVERTDVFIGHSDYTSCKAFPGSIAELLVYSRAVDDAELIEIESYMQNKFDCCSE